MTPGKGIFCLPSLLQWRKKTWKAKHAHGFGFRCGDKPDVFRFIADFIDGHYLDIIAFKIPEYTINMLEVCQGFSQVKPVIISIYPLRHKKNSDRQMPHKK